MPTKPKRRRRSQWDLFCDRYLPIKNLLLGDDEGPFDGLMFETFGEEWEFVRYHKGHYVWTLVEAEEKWYVIPGFHLVNRMGYFICQKPWKPENEQETYRA